jgi:hypothetical protein
MSGNGPMHLSLEFYEDGSRARIELVACCDRPHTLAHTPALRSITFQISGASYRFVHIDPRSLYSLTPLFGLRSMQGQRGGFVQSRGSYNESGHS